MGKGKVGVRVSERRKEWRLLGLLHTHDLVSCGESEEDLSDERTYCWNEQ